MHHGDQGLVGEPPVLGPHILTQGIRVWLSFLLSHFHFRFNKGEEDLGGIHTQQTRVQMGAWFWQETAPKHTHAHTCTHMSHSCPNILTFFPCFPGV